MLEKNTVVTYNVTIYGDGTFFICHGNSYFFPHLVSYRAENALAQWMLNVDIDGVMLTLHSQVSVRMEVKVRATTLAGCGMKLPMATSWILVTWTAGSGKRMETGSNQS